MSDLNSVSEYCCEKNRIILTENELEIPGLRMIGRASLHSAHEPLATHYHQDCIEIVIVLKGGQTYYTENGAFKLSGGDIFTAFLNQKHGSGESPEEVNEFIWLQIDLKPMKGFLGLNHDFGEVLRKKLSERTTIVYKSKPDERKLIKNAFAFFSSMQSDDIFQGLVLLVNFLNKISYVNENNINTKSFFSDVINYIDENIENVIEMSELAKICGLSQSRFKHRFSEEIGFMPRYYINQKKIEKAKNMLKNNEDDSILDIAFLLGFTSSSYFSAVFKKFTGYTPSEYKKRPQ